MKPEDIALLADMLNSVQTVYSQTDIMKYRYGREADQLLGMLDGCLETAQYIINILSELETVK